MSKKRKLSHFYIAFFGSVSKYMRSKASANNQTVEDTCWRLLRRARKGEDPGRFTSMKDCHNTYYIMVIEDLNSHSLVGTVTLLIEQKFIHTIALRGRIEDVVVSNDHRGKQLGKLLLDTACLLAQKLGVYKLSLDCKDALIPFYQTFGLKHENVNMLVIRYTD